MTTVFVAGSMNIKHLDQKIKERINNIVASKFNVVVGDADGVDKSIQEYLFEHGAHNITVYCSGDRPRNNVGNWPINKVDSLHSPGTRAFFTAKDIEMAKIADFGLMIWDTKSTGTLSNIIELLNRKKKTVVFIHKSKEFQTITEVSDLEGLSMYMSEQSRLKANEKIKLFDKIQSLKYEQSRMFG